MIGLDTRMIDSSGIGTTIRGLIDHFTPDQRARIKFCDGPYPVYGWRQHWSYGRYLNRERLSLYHMPHYDVPLSYRGKLVVTVHDLIHYLFPQYSTKPFTRVYARYMLGHVARRAAKIIVVSENTKKDLERLFPASVGKTVMLNPAVGASYAPVREEEIRRVLDTHGLSRGYLLYVGNLREGKNIRRLLGAVEALKKRNPDTPTLVLAGKNALRWFDPAKLPPHVRYVGAVPIDQLPALYAAASVFVFPSLYEGFGLPPLEAMACGTPAVVSNVASLPEVCGDAATYVDPLSEESIARGIEGLIGSPDLRRQFSERGRARAKKFTWNNFAQGTWRVYEEVLAS